MLHVVSGDAGLARLRHDGFQGRVAVQRDSPAVGPWDADPSRCTALRAAFWEDRDAEPVTRLDPRPGETLRLHFAAEPWDQLAQLAVLAALDGRPEPGPLLTEDGPIDPEDLTRALALFDRVATQDWRGLEASVPDLLPRLPHLLPAVARVIEDHPAQGEGRTERQIRSLQAQGVRSLPALMAALADLEMPWGLAWYGDRVVAKVAATPR